MRHRPPREFVRSVIFALVLREMRARFGQLRLGALWVFLEPVAHMAALSTFLVLRSHPSPGYDFLVWLIVGLAPFLLFMNIALTLMGSVITNKVLFSYKQIEPSDAFVTTTSVEFFICCFVFIL